jgi:hypothetical protein
MPIYRKDGKEIKPEDISDELFEEITGFKAIEDKIRGKTMIWNLLHPAMTPEHLGLLPSMLSEVDPRPAREQFDERYICGWDPFPGFTLEKDNSLTYPGDPRLKPLASAMLRDELIVFYQHAWVAIVQPDRSFEVCRMD